MLSISGLARPRMSVLHGHRTVRGSKTQSPRDMIDRSMEIIKMSDSKSLGFDLWSRPAPLLDLHVPTPWSVSIKNGNLLYGLRFAWSGAENKISNAVAMFNIARSHSLPWNPTASGYSFQIFRSSSVKPNTWLEPLRDMARENYEQINKAVARNEMDTVKKLTAGDYRKTVLARIKALHPSQTVKQKNTTPSPSHVWRLHSLASPIKCVSIRATEGNLSRREPLIGTRYMVQACLRFDTWQSLTLSSATPSSPPEPKRVLEYLVLEKKMWYDGPWVVRDQLWENVLGETSSDVS